MARAASAAPATTIRVDHISLAVQNLYEGSARFQAETGFGVGEGGWFPTLGGANRIAPLGDDTYIEIESVIDPFEIQRGNPGAVWFSKQVVDGDVFAGWSCRVSSRDEFEQIAKRLKSDIVVGPLRSRPDGSVMIATRVPDSMKTWRKGLPSFFYTPDLAHHPSRVPVESVNKPTGLAWMEVGGTEAEMSDWLGIPASTLPLRFVGGSHGLYAVGVNSARGVVEIRRKPIVIE